MMSHKFLQLDTQSRTGSFSANEETEMSLTYIIGTKYV